MFTPRHIARILTTLALTLTMLPWGLGRAEPVHAADAPDPRDWDRRVEVFVSQVYISDDHDYAAGDIQITQTLSRYVKGCQPGQRNKPECQAQLARTKSREFDQVFDGSTILLYQGMPEAGSGGWVADASISPEIGIPLWADQEYQFKLDVWDIDTFADDWLGYYTADLNVDNGWFVGNHVARGVKDGGREPGDFSGSFVIRDAHLPDLRPVNIKVTEVPGTGKHQLCVAVQNTGRLDAGPFEIAVQVDGATPGDGRVVAGGLASGQATEPCVQTALSPGKHQLTAVVDEPRQLMEVSETNNRYTQPYATARVWETQSPESQPSIAIADGTTGQSVPVVPGGPAGASGPAGQPSPGADGADLTAGAIRVNGQSPDSKNACKDGKSAVTVLVKNGGGAKAAGFAVRLEVDGDQAGVTSVNGLEPGKEREVHFGDVRLKKGEHTLVATVDVKAEVDETTEKNNVLKVTAQCSPSD